VYGGVLAHAIPRRDRAATKENRRDAERVISHNPPWRVCRSISPAIHCGVWAGRLFSKPF
jgi:hypothetical protein